MIGKEAAKRDISPGKLRDRMARLSNPASRDGVKIREVKIISIEDYKVRANPAGAKRSKDICAPARRAPKS